MFFNQKLESRFRFLFVEFHFDENHKDCGKMHRETIAKRVFLSPGEKKHVFFTLFSFFWKSVRFHHLRRKMTILVFFDKKRPNFQWQFLRTREKTKKMFVPICSFFLKGFSFLDFFDSRLTGISRARAGRAVISFNWSCSTCTCSTFTCPKLPQAVFQSI